MNDVKEYVNSMSTSWCIYGALIVRIAEGGLNFYFSFSFLFYFLFQFRSIFLFLELGLGLHSRSHQMTRSQVTRHIEGRRRFWIDDVIQHVKYMLTLRHTHGCLG